MKVLYHKKSSKMPRRVYVDSTSSDVFVVSFEKDFQKTCSPTFSGTVGDEFWIRNLLFSMYFVKNSIEGEPYDCWHNASAMDLDMFTEKTNLSFRVKRSRPDAILPNKAHPSDAGFDITITHQIKKEGDVTFYGTGLHVEPPFGYYFQLVPRSSISKTGYSLANSVGIIDAGYQGELIVALRKNNPEKENLVLPCKLVQLVPFEIYSMRPMEVPSFLGETSRGTGGFGSTSLEPPVQL